MAGLGRAGSFCHGMWVVGLAWLVDGVFVVAGICMRGLESGERHHALVLQLVKGDFFRPAVEEYSERALVDGESWWVTEYDE